MAFGDLLEALNELHEEENSWTVDEITISVATSLEDDTLIDLNLASTIGHGKRVNKNTEQPHVYWLPSGFCQNNERFRVNELIPCFVTCCRQSGFPLTSKGWDPERQAIRFACRHYRHFQDRSVERAEKRQALNKPPVGIMCFSIILTIFRQE